MTAVVRTLVADDERPARRKILARLQDRPEVQVVGEAANGLETVDAIRELTPHLVFLDIQMPGMSGFEVIETIGAQSMPAVVFVTAYDEYALDAFEVAAVDYLLKPFSERRFEAALRRALAQIGSQAREEERIVRLLEQVRSRPGFLQRIVVREADRLFLVRVAEVARFVAKGNYVEVHTATARHLVRETIKSLESRLDPDRFVRIHRSEIVNIDFIDELQPWFHGDYVVLLKGGAKTRMSRRYSDRLFRNLDR